MQLAHDNFPSSGLPSGPETGAGKAGIALSAELIQCLLTSPDTPREMLLAALQESQRQFESLLSCLSGAFYRCELTLPWKMEFMTAGVEAITGYDAAFFVDTPYVDILEPEDVAPLDRIIEEAITRKEHFNACYRVRHKSGEIRWVQEHGKAIYDEAGTPLYLEGFISDVTEKKTLEAETEKSRREIEKLNEKMFIILDGTLDEISAVDNDWNYVFANKSYFNSTNTDKGIIGKNALEIFPHFKETQEWPAIQKALETRQPAILECHNARINKWYQLHAYPHEDGLTTFYRNITAQKQLEDTLQEQANALRTMLDHVPAMVWTAPPDGYGDFFNTHWNEFLGVDTCDYRRGVNGPEGTLFHPEDQDAVLSSWLHSVRTGEPYEQEYRLRHHSGEYRWVLARAWPQKDQDGKVVRWYGASTDIHERVQTERKLKESRKLRENMLDASTDCILFTDLEGRLLEINAPGLLALEVDDPDTILGESWPALWPNKSRNLARQAIKEAGKGHPSRFVGYCPTAKSEPKWWDVIVTPVRDADGAVINLLCIARDITEQRATAEKLRHASEQDSLTLLPNRRVFEHHLKSIAAAAAREGHSIGLMLLDLDYFKHVNDSLGHLAGDHLLQVIAKRLKGCIGGNGFVARLGGDEFAVVLDDIHGDQELTETAARILSSIEKPVTYAGKAIDGGVSIGCAVFPRDATDAQDLFKMADTALYDLKTSGRGGVQMFNGQMMEAAKRSANQLTLARRAIHEDAVQPFYQPKVWLETGEVAGFEALLRWWSPGTGIQPPSTVAEAFCDYELSTKIGTLMLGHVIEDLSSWIAAGLDVKPVSINASPAEFLRDDYAERMLERIDKAGIPHSLIEVEITEHALLERRSEHVVRALRLLNEAGVKIALDDFGTGYSSLSHLRDFPVDVLKIDQSFVSRMLVDPAMEAIVMAITRLGPSLSLDIVAEGIETPEQLNLLRGAGCQLGQGYLFGKAMDARELVQRLSTGRWPFRVRTVS